MTNPDLMTFQEAARWASSYLGRQVTVSNISYLIQYGKILKFSEESSLVSKKELKKYYDTEIIPQEFIWKEQLGDDINWELSFSDIRESERTKHVHRLHPYKGKYIPQLVEYFLDSHYFKKRDIIMDPFVGSGTTLVQCIELGLHSIGIDISRYNCMISEAKTGSYDLQSLKTSLSAAAESTAMHSVSRFSFQKNQMLNSALTEVNQRFYPNPEYKQLVSHIRRHQQGFTSEAESRLRQLKQHASIKFDFTLNPLNKNLVNEFTYKYSQVALSVLEQALDGKLVATDIDDEDGSEFLQKWFVPRQRDEMQHYIAQIEGQKDEKIRNLLRIILSRTARSCRATTHSDLATLVKPQYAPYYCRKHYKICRPVSTIIPHLRRYTKDTIKRLKIFSSLKQDVFAEVINADSSSVDIISAIESQNPKFSKILNKQKIAGIFTSPPYVGQINYHEQHAYAYELFQIERKDDLEIGRKKNGVSKKAQDDYIKGISSVLRNLARFLRDDAHVFIVANDQRNLYPAIVNKSGFRIVETFRRPVLNRTERDKQPYAESIFHMMKE